MAEAGANDPCLPSISRVKYNVILSWEVGHKRGENVDKKDEMKKKTPDTLQMLRREGRKKDKKENRQAHIKRSMPDSNRRSWNESREEIKIQCPNH